MRAFSHFLYVLLLSALLGGCDLGTTRGCDDGDSDCEPNRRYLYVAQRADGGGDAARGTLVLRFPDGEKENIVDQIVGTWRIERLEGAGELGPQTGEGELRGVVRADGSVRIDLAPDSAEHGVVLTGTFTTADRSVLDGKWTYQAADDRTSGEFEASQTGPLE